MRLLAMLVLLAMLLCMPAAASARPGPAGPAGAAANASAFEGPREAYVMLIRLRQDLWLRYRQSGKWPDDPAADAALNGHVKYWRDKLAEGPALFAGGMEGDFWDNASSSVFEAASREEAQAMVDADPAVRAFVFQAQVRPFTIHWMTDRFEGTDR